MYIKRFTFTARCMLFPSALYDLADVESAAVKNILTHYTQKFLRPLQ